MAKRGKATAKRGRFKVQRLVEIKGQVTRGGKTVVLGKTWRTFRECATLSQAADTIAVLKSVPETRFSSFRVAEQGAKDSEPQAVY